MSASFDVNWMTSSLIIYVVLIMQIEVRNSKLLLFDKIFVISSFRLYSYLYSYFRLQTHVFLLISEKFDVQPFGKSMGGGAPNYPPPPWINL